MRTLWEIVNKHFDSESAAAAFLTINLLDGRHTCRGAFVLPDHRHSGSALHYKADVCRHLCRNYRWIAWRDFISLPQKNTVALLRSWCRCGCSRLLQRLPGLRVYGCLRRP